jgi:hypothetical protein
MEEKDPEELSWRLEDVWLRSFKLRVNLARFNRKEDHREQVGEARQAPATEGVGMRQQGRSFKADLVCSSSHNESDFRGKGLDEGNEIMEVAMEGSVLKELEASFVGSLAVNVEVYRIRTVLLWKDLLISLSLIWVETWFLFIALSWGRWRSFGKQRLTGSHIILEMWFHGRPLVLLTEGIHG